jgi:putative FmdB family regulatory protein
MGVDDHFFVISIGPIYLGAGAHMPINEYRCEKCNCEFEYLKLSGHDVDPKCPTCCGNNVRRLISVGNIRTQGIARGKGGFPEPKCKPKGG